MKLFLRFFILLLALLPALVQANGTVPTEPAGFQPNFLISDPDFLNGSAMTGDAINTFLANNQSWLANYIIPEYVNVPYYCQDGSGNDVTQYISVRQWNDVSSTPLFGMRFADLLAERAQTIGINPEVLLVLLERESTGVTNSAPSSSFTQAWPIFYGFDEKMATWSYTCAQAQSVASSYGGVGQQFAYAAFSLKNQYNAATNWQNPITIDGTTFTPQSRATKVLYIYTPHISPGNENFWSFFTSWFGSQPPPPYVPVLKLDPSSGTVYLIEQGYKWPVSGSGFSGWNFTWAGVSGTITSDQLALPTGAVITSLARGSDNTVYWIDNGKKRVITSARIFTNLGFDWGQVSPISDAILNELPYGLPAYELVSPTNGDGTVYIATENTLYPVSGDIFNNAWGYNMSEVGHVPGYVTMNLTLGPLYSRLALPDHGNNTVYLIDRGIGYALTGAVAAQWGLDLSQVRKVGNSLLDEKANGGLLTQLVRQDGGDGTIYYVSGGKKAPLTAAAWRNRGYSFASVRVVSASLLNLLPTAAVLTN